MATSGVVSVLYTDIEGSTRLWEEHGGAVADMLAQHDRLLVGAVTEAGASERFVQVTPREAGSVQ